jgi:hypothetical protein
MTNIYHWIPDAFGEILPLSVIWSQKVTDRTHVLI